MAVDAHKNFAYSLVATAPSPATSGTSLVVTAADGTKFPAASFNATIWPAGVQPTSANAEIVRVTAISTDTFTITRAQESSSARTVIVGDQIAATITAKTLTDVEAGPPTTNANLTGDVTSSGNATTIGANKVKPGMLSTGAAYATVATVQTTTSTTTTDLTTPGPAVTVTIGANGLALVTIGSILQNNTNGDYAEMSFAISGATTRATGAPYRLYMQATGAGTPDIKTTYTVLVTGLSTGSTTFTSKYRAITGGTATFGEREISVIPL